METMTKADEAWNEKFNDLMENTAEGSRHSALVTLTNMLRWKGIGPGQTLTILRYYAREWPWTAEAMPDKEIEETVKDAYRRYLHEGMDPLVAHPGRATPEEGDAFGDYIPLTLDELAAGSPEKAGVVAEGLLHRGDLLLIFAGAGVGKSTRTENMAAQLAAGRPVYGAFPVGRQHRVLLWELENPLYEVVERMRMLRKAYPFGDNLRVGVFPSLDLGRPENWRTLRQGVEAFRPDVLIIEPLASMHTGDENSASEMREALTPLKGLAAEFDIAVVLCHHKGWGAEGVAHKRPRGSTAIMDVVTTAIEVEDLGEYKSRLAFTKSRSVGRTPVRELELRYDPETHTLELADPREYRSIEAVFMVARLRERGHTLERIGDALGTSKQVVSRWSRQGQAPNDEFYQRLKRLFASVTEGPSLGYPE